jgi:hypothetical protein
MSPLGPWHLSVMKTPVTLPPNDREHRMRRRFKQTVSLYDRLAWFAQEAGKKAAQLPAGGERDDMIKKARQADTATHLDDRANSPGLQPPKSSSQVD